MQNDEKIKNKGNLKTVYFQIAGHIMELNFPNQMEVDLCLPSFVNFKTNTSKDKTKISVRVDIGKYPDEKTEKKLLSHFSIMWGERFRFEETSENYITTVQNESHGKDWKMYSTRDFRKSVIYAVEEELCSTSTLSWLLMVVFGQAVLSYNTVLLHASVVEKDGFGYGFLGKSGTGKSTQSSLWCKHLSGVTLLNDDNPAVRVMGKDEVLIFGTPWSGKTHCYINKGIPLRGLVRLNQASENRWIKVEGKEALLSILSSCTAIRWNRILFNNMLNSLEKIISKINIGKLSCLPNKEAALLCSTELIKK